MQIVASLISSSLIAIVIVLSLVFLAGGFSVLWYAAFSRRERAESSGARPSSIM